MLSCESSSDSHFETHPCVIVEVISPSTAKVDRVEKLSNYKKIPSLMAYVLVEPRCGNCEITLSRFVA